MGLGSDILPCTYVEISANHIGLGSVILPCPYADLDVRQIFIVINRWFSQHKRATIYWVLAFLEIPELYFAFNDMRKYFFL
jgi:hypothetical protein